MPATVSRPVRGRFAAIRAALGAVIVLATLALAADWFPESHRAFIAGCRDYYETPTHLFVHAGFVPDLPLSEQPGLALRWRVTDAAAAVRHRSGKVAVVGHTPQHSGEVLDLGFLVCIDTNCAHGGWLTALDVESGQVWQADRSGRLRSDAVKAMVAEAEPGVTIGRTARGS
jgi:hypothetical protein